MNSIEVTIHRVKNQIGGFIIEVSTDTTRVILDAGAELSLSTFPPPPVPDFSGLFSGEAQYGAVFFTHYHGDHIGLFDQIIPEISTVTWVEKP